MAEMVARAATLINNWYLNKSFPGGAPADDPETVIQQVVDQTRAEIIASLQEMADVQCSDGNWNLNSYMHGIANGMICVVASLKGEEAEFMEKPERYIENA